MAMDIYTGSFTRYFLGLWQNEAQQLIEGEGGEYRIIRPDEEYDTDTSIDVEEGTQIIQKWLNNLGKTFGIFMDLNEGPSVPYYTTRFEEYLNLYTANCYTLYTEIDLNTLVNDPKIEAKAEKEYPFIFFKDVEVWFPLKLPDTGIFEVTFPNDIQKIVSTTELLTKELDKISYRLTNKSLKEIEENYNSLSEDDQCWVEDTGLLTFYKHTKFSLQHKVPIILDY